MQLTQGRTYLAGVPCWIELEQPDLETTQAFYGALFGWEFEDAVALLDGVAVAGVSTGAGGGWTTAIAVDDMEDAVRAVVASGGAAGAGARCADPAGATFRLRRREELGAQIVNVPGAWNFSNLHTSDLGAARRFYGEVFGWEATDVGGGAAMQRLPGYGDHLAATVDPDIYERQANAPEGFADVVAGLAVCGGGEAPAWRVVFTVADRDEAVRRARNLWATVVATEETMWTRTATIRDPQGAELTLSQFSPPGE